jgi:serine-type D-Ala-D-Ala endopeptidase (penicillin-binding protein 7)
MRMCEICRALANLLFDCIQRQTLNRFKSLVIGFFVILLGVSLNVHAGTQAHKKKSKTVSVKQVTASVKHSGAKRLAKAPVRSKKKATRVLATRPVVPLSYGQLAGLHSTEDALALKSSVALVVDQETKEVLFSKNDQAVLPIASITKLMTGVVISEAKLSLDEMITITDADVDTEKGSTSRLRIGTELSRGELLHLALMSSENRAAHALGRTFPGGLTAFVEHMNVKARLLGMRDTRYVEPTGLSSKNQSSARDLATLVNFAYSDSLLRELSTSTGYQVEVGSRTLQFNNTNQLVKNPDWEIGLQKTGYISEAGQCLVMQAKIAGRKLIMVFLDSAGKLTRIADAERVRRWIEKLPASAQKYSATSASQNLDHLIQVN